MTIVLRNFVSMMLYILVDLKEIYFVLKIYVNLIPCKKIILDIFVSLLYFLTKDISYKNFLYDPISYIIPLLHLLKTFIGHGQLCHSCLGLCEVLDFLITITFFSRCFGRNLKIFFTIFIQFKHFPMIKDHW